METRKQCVLLSVVIITAFSSLSYHILPAIANYYRGNSVQYHLPKETNRSSYAIPEKRLFYSTKKFRSCQGLFENNTQALELASKSKLIVETEYDLYKTFADCQSVRSRYFYRTSPASNEEAAFPLAYAIAVNEDLAQVELLLNAIYEPQNSYCIHIDLKSSSVFSEALRRYISCFPNIVFPEEQFSITSTGINVMTAFLSCYHRLVSFNPNWKYLFTLQGHDFPLRTNMELVYITRDILAGANDVDIEQCWTERYLRQFSFVYNTEGLEIGYNFNAKPFGPPHGIQLVNVSLDCYKGYIQSTLTREFVEYLLSHRTTYDWLNYLHHGESSDELFVNSLNYSPEKFPAPGTTPGRCFRGTRYVSPKDWYISRYTEWHNGKHEANPCKGRWQHFQCIYSQFDLHRIFRKPQLFLNKLRIRYFPVTVYCMHELHFNKTNRPEEYPSLEYGYDPELYNKLETVKFRRWKDANPGMPLERYDCSQ